LGLLSKKTTILNALRVPIPGKPDKAFTAFSIILDE
jgi:hypothetical protein